MTYAVAILLLLVTTLGLWVTLVFPAWVLGVSIYILVMNYGLGLARHTTGS